MNVVIKGIRISLKNKHAEKELREGHSENVLKIVKEVFELDDANAVGLSNILDRVKEELSRRKEAQRAHGGIVRALIVSF